MIGCDMKQSVWMSMSSDENIRMFQALSLWLQDSFGHVDSGFTQTSAFFKLDSPRQMNS